MNKKILKWNFIFQYGWVLTNIFNSLLLLPLYLKNIDKDTLGVWLATGNILAWMTLVDPGLGEVLQQKIAELRGQHKMAEVNKTLGSGYVASGIILLISIVIGFVCYFCIGAIIKKDISHYQHLPMALLLSIIATGMSLVSFGLSGINQGLHNAAQVAISSLSANFLFLAVNLIFLYLGYGILSIAFANLCRAVYINIYNITTMLKVLKKESIKIIFELAHFKKFIRIFSVTSVSKIITGISYSIDMIVLARYIPPAMITLYEINKRPINVAYSLIGRHSVALMPLISHAKGRDDKAFITNLVYKQFRFYCYAVLFTALIFCFNYNNLIATWTGDGQFAGNTILYLLVSSFFLSLLSYFMAIVGYALGDIKMNSFYNIIRNVIFGILMFFAARYYGIIGTVVVSIGITFFADLFFYSYRLYKLGYLSATLLSSVFRYWPVIVPVAAAAGWALSHLVMNLMPAGLHFSKLMLNAGTFTLFFISLILLVDRQMRQKSKALVAYLIAPINKLRRA